MINLLHSWIFITIILAILWLAILFAEMRKAKKHKGGKNGTKSKS
jgi:hypothetical protein